MHDPAIRWSGTRAGLDYSLEKRNDDGKELATIGNGFRHRARLRHTRIHGRSGARGGRVQASDALGLQRRRLLRTRQ